MGKREYDKRFYFLEDVANGMINVVLKNIKGPINLGSGTGYTIKKLIKVILSDKGIKHKPKIFWINQTFWG